MQVSTCWTEAATPELHGAIRDRIALSLCQYYNGSTDRLGFYRESILKREYAAILNHTIDCNDASANVWDLIGLRQVQALYTKDSYLTVEGVDPRKNALEKWQLAEALCKETNKRFHSTIYHGCFHDKLEWARKWLRRALGVAPVFSGLPLRFGPGATADIKKQDASIVNKLAFGKTCSLDLIASGRVPELLRELPHFTDCHTTDYSIDEEGWLVGHVSLQICGGKLRFVPKKWSESRCMDVQPSLNTLLQCGIGDYMMAKLKSAGLNLYDGEHLNRRLARKGSITGSLATVDLSSASDTISTALVRYLLPRDWYLLLSAARCGTTTVEGIEVTLEKFAAMGNGFTFPLESAIFHALSLAVNALSPDAQDSDEINTFGDDMVVHTTNYAALTDLLEYCGFQINKLKSYSSGPFRESCGGDYWNGIDIRPFFLKEKICGETLFTMHNYFTRLGQTELASVVRAFIPTPLRLYGPDGFGDGHLVSYSWKRIVKRADIRKGYEGSYFDTYRHDPIKIPTRFHGDYVTPLYNVYISQTNSLFIDKPPLDFTKGGRPMWVYPGKLGYSRISIYTLGS